MKEDDVVRGQNKSEVIEMVERLLPNFAMQCREPNGECIILVQECWADDYKPTEMVLLGAAIKYAGIYGKELVIINQT